MRRVWIVGLLIALSACKSMQTKTSEVPFACDWVVDHASSGALFAICATAEEVRRYGRNAKVIYNQRFRDAGQ